MWNVDDMLYLSHSHNNLTVLSFFFCSHDDELSTQKFVVCCWSKVNEFCQQWWDQLNELINKSNTHTQSDS